ncbi:hypothetical protein M8J75_008085 [Diaphorina citri]|nr:hypothetical protein M8J75_008085 [Diaphorina citri]
MSEALSTAHNIIIKTLYLGISSDFNLFEMMILRRSDDFARGNDSSAVGIPDQPPYLLYCPSLKTNDQSLITKTTTPRASIRGDHSVRSRFDAHIRSGEDHWLPVNSSHAEAVGERGGEGSAHRALLIIITGDGNLARRATQDAERGGVWRQPSWNRAHQHSAGLLNESAFRYA